MLKSLSAKK